MRRHESSSDLAESDRLPALLLIAGACVCGSSEVLAQSGSQPVEWAEPAPLASRSLLLDIAAAGERLVVVGERGHVLFSDDRGASWKQAEKVPTRALLTGVCFADAQRGVAVGHDEVIIVTADAGNTWDRVHYAPEAQQPLLDVWCGDGRAIAVGAYSSYYTSEDGGRTWVPRKFEAAPLVPPPAAATSAGESQYEDDLPADYHLNRIAVASSSRFYIAGEAGRLYRSDDAGLTWLELPSPYEGSFFGITPLAGDTVLAYGLRGNLYRSDNAGASWERVSTDTVAMLNDAVSMNGSVAVVGLSGTVLLSTDQARKFSLLQQPDRRGISAAIATGPGTLVTVGEGGVKIITLTQRDRT